MTSHSLVYFESPLFLHSCYGVIRCMTPYTHMHGFEFGCLRHSLYFACRIRSQYSFSMVQIRPWVIWEKNEPRLWVNHLSNMGTSRKDEPCDDGIRRECHRKGGPSRSGSQKTRPAKEIGRWRVDSWRTGFLHERPSWPKTKLVEQTRPFAMDLDDWYLPESRHVWEWVRIVWTYI